MRRSAVINWMEHVPKDFWENLAFRKEILRAAQKDPIIRSDCWKACSDSIQFYTNAFLFTYDPRRDPCTVVPFVTWPFQDEALATLDETIGEEDLVIRKSRDMGASWLILVAFLWRWHFRDMQSFLLVSRKEDLVDKKGSSDCLFWKLDFMLDRLPGWMVPAHDRADMRLTNMENGSMIDGESTNGDVGRGGRRTAILMDEFAAVDAGKSNKALSATAANTNSRIFNSTPQGTSGGFADMVENRKIKQLVLHWSRHPLKNVGLTKDERGRWTSPWYVRECERLGDPRRIAQELDMDLRAGESLYFEPAVIDACMARTRPPVWRGEIVYDKNTTMPERLAEDPRGRLWLWMQPTGTGQIPLTGDRYVAGIDIGSGTGAGLGAGEGSANSVMSIASIRHGCKVAEYADPNMRPDLFAELCVALARMFKDHVACKIAWEAAGPGLHFGKRVMESGYREIHWRMTSELWNGTPTAKPGWWPTRENKNLLYAAYSSALRNGALQNPSREAIGELRNMLYDNSGNVINIYAERTDDPSGAKLNHADRPTADALMWMLMDGVAGRLEKAEKAQTVPGSFKWRKELASKNAVRSRSDESILCATARDN
jgi:hypothetical protein